MNDIDKLIPAYIRELPTYRGVEAARPKQLRLNAMESPYGLEELQALWLQTLARVEVNRYPLAHTPAFLRQVQESFQLPIDNEVLLGNGSDEIILLLLLLCGGARARVMSPAPSFVIYEHLTRALGGAYIGVPLEEDFSLATDKFIAAIERHQPQLIFLALPNNPTGNIFAADLVERCLTVSKGLVVVDQAYRFFTAPYELPQRRKNLLLLQTLSKLGMAGLRFGFLSADPHLVRQLHKIRLPYNINALTLAGVQFVLEHLSFFLDKCKRIARERKHLYKELQTLDAIRAYPSEANFILFRCLRRSASDVFERLRSQGILIKNLTNSHPALKNCLRISMGLPEENRVFLTALRAQFNEK